MSNATASTASCCATRAASTARLGAVICRPAALQRCCQPSRFSLFTALSGDNIGRGLFENGRNTLCFRAAPLGAAHEQGMLEGVDCLAEGRRHRPFRRHAPAVLGSFGHGLDGGAVLVEIAAPLVGDCIELAPALFV